jgi:hypothetical protein
MMVHARIAASKRMNRIRICRAILGGLNMFGLVVSFSAAWPGISVPVILGVRSQGNDLTETPRHGEERKRKLDVVRLRSTRSGESAMETFGPFQSSKVKVPSPDSAAPRDEFIFVSLRLRESQEPSANKTWHASGRQRRFPGRSQTLPPRELGRWGFRSLLLATCPQSWSAWRCFSALAVDCSAPWVVLFDDATPQRVSDLSRVTASVSGIRRL